VPLQVQRADQAKSMTDYQPISCIDHERLEFAALKKQWLSVTVKHGDKAGTHRLLPLDVYARDGVEWLDAVTESGMKLRLRLDEISFCG
jgi:Rho-binding antiterminator